MSAEGGDPGLAEHARTMVAKGGKEGCRGGLDQFLRTRSIGWIADNDLDSLEVALLVNNAPVARSVANIFRSDVAEAGVSSGFNGFELTYDLSSFDAEAEVDLVCLSNGAYFDLPVRHVGQVPRLTGMRGTIDVVTPFDVTGWVIDQETPDVYAKVDVFLEGTLVDSFRADQFRQDLLAAGIGDGKHGFVYSTHKLAQHGNATVLFRSGDLTLGTVVLGTDASGKIELRSHLDRVAGRRLFGWAMNAQAEAETVHVELLVNGRPVSVSKADFHRPDLRVFAVENANHGFVIDLPEKVTDGDAIVLKIRGTDLQVENGAFTFRGWASKYRPADFSLTLPPTNIEAFRRFVKGDERSLGFVAAGDAAYEVQTYDRKVVHRNQASCLLVSVGNVEVKKTPLMLEMVENRDFWGFKKGWLFFFGVSAPKLGSANVDAEMARLMSQGFPTDRVNKLPVQNLICVNPDSAAPFLLRQVNPDARLHVIIDRQCKLKQDITAFAPYIDTLVTDELPPQPELFRNIVVAQHDFIHNTLTLLITDHRSKEFNMFIPVFERSPQPPLDHAITDDLDIDLFFKMAGRTVPFTQTFREYIDFLIENADAIYMRENYVHRYRYLLSSQCHSQAVRFAFIDGARCEVR